MAAYEELRRRHCLAAERLAPAMKRRLDWSTDRLAEHRREGLRRLLRVAMSASPWHARRLAGVDPARFEEADLAELPMMTRDDLMEHFDEIVTDRRVTRAAVEDHVAGLTGDAYLMGRYHVVASGGSTGRRGVFVVGWEAWARRWLAWTRHVLRAMAPRPDGSVLRAAMIVGGDPAHGTSALSATFSGCQFDVTVLPVTQPIGDLVSVLHQIDPDLVVGYPSALRLLLAEAEAGTLHIRPACVVGTSEVLLPQLHAALRGAWGARVIDAWTASEAGSLAYSCEVQPGMHVSDDLVVVEPVDDQGRPVPAGTASTGVLLTNFHNLVLPLIRYELSDQVTPMAERCACGSAFGRIAGVSGRREDVFVYDGCRVSALSFEGPLSRPRNVLEYQVIQTPVGAAIDVHRVGPVDRERLEAEIAANLARAGVRHPEVVVREVPRLDRTATGKLKRFIPLDHRAEEAGAC